jgi:hypothetical protein
MNLHSVLVHLQDLWLSAVVRGDIPGTEWVFPIVETCHVLTLTLVFGSIVMVDLRLLGWTSRATSIARLIEETLPWTWTAWVLAATTGSMLFISKAVTYAGNFEFRMKFVCMVLAAVNMLVFHFGAYRRVAEWDLARPPAAARLAGGLSMTFWIAVIFFGRWVGFTT